MAFSSGDLYSEVLTVITERAGDNIIISRGWLVSAVLMKHPLKRHKKKDPDDFSLCCRQLAVAAAVDTALAKMKKYDDGGLDPDEADDLPGLPKIAGYQRLRRLYPLRRAGLIVLVPLELMTDEEIEAKAKRYDAASNGFAEHSDELRRYLANRQRQHTGTG